MSNREEKIASLLHKARSEISLRSTLTILREAEKEAQDWVNSEDNAHSYQFLSSVFAEIAQNNTRPDERNKLWQQALSVATKGWERNRDYRLAFELGARTVDYIEDEFADKSPAELRRAISKAKSIMSEGINQETNHNIRAVLLARKSAILRFSALLSISREEQKKIAGEAYRCASKAVQEGGRIGEIALQEGLAVWLKARYSRNDLEYNTLLQEAEECFWLACQTGDKIYSLLTLARFFRQTYQPTACCDTFSRYLTTETQKRRAWRNSYIYGEAATQLWYAKYPQELIEKHCREAEFLLEQALDAGYNTARNVVALSFVKACSGDKVGGESALAEIFHGEDAVSWQTAIRIATQAFTNGYFSSNLIAKGFALGINDGRIWSKLGTFALDFLDDWELAERLYKEAIKLSPRDPISLTNLARLLVSKGGEPEKEKAKRLLSKAGTYSDPRFNWWRVVRSLLESKKIGQVSYATGRYQPETLPRAFSLKKLRKQFRLLKSLGDPQKRGILFNQFLKSLMEVSLGNARGPYRIQAGVKYQDELDGAIYFDKGAYLYEARWRKKKADKNWIGEFTEKLKPLGVWGLFISMSGFDEGAIEKAQEHIKEKRILLMDGDELEIVIEQFLPLDRLLSIKQMHYFFDSNPYHKVTSDLIKISA